MARRLALNTAGIKSPLDVGDEPAPAAAGGVATAATPPAQPKRAPRRKVPPAAAAAASAEPGSRAQTKDGLDEGPFYGGGRPLQTSVALNTGHLESLAELARASALSLNAIAVAAIHAGLPRSSDGARQSILDERVSRAGVRNSRMERNLRLPQQLRARVDELTAGARQRLPRSERADLINAALSVGLPAEAQAAAELVAAHARQLELAGGN